LFFHAFMEGERATPNCQSKIPGNVHTEGNVQLNKIHLQFGLNSAIGKKQGVCIFETFTLSRGGWDWDMYYIHFFLNNAK